MIGKRYVRKLIFWSALILGTVSIFVIVRAYVFRTFRVVSESMVPSLLEGDSVLVSKVSYQLPASLAGLIGVGPLRLAPERGDVVVFSRFSEYQSNTPGRHFIKRIVAIPGDKLGVRDGKVVLGASADDGNEYEYGPVQLKSGQYFVMGDNRLNSKDSRYFGPINLSDIEGRALMIVWSSQKVLGRTKLRTQRFGMYLR